MKPNPTFFRKHIILIVAAMALVTLALPSPAQNPHVNSYEISFLVSDQPGVATQRDTRLLNAWGLALAPEKFGQFGGALLVGNFGDGAINAYHPESGEFLGALADKDGKPILIPGLWTLNFKARHVSHGDHDEDDRTTSDLYFTAGPGGENDGLLGLIRPVPHPHH